MEKGEKNEGATPAPEAIKVRVGEEEKTLTAAEVAEMLGRQSGLQNKINELSPFQKVMERYNVDPETYLRHSEGAIAIASKLIEEGFIDPQGNIVKKESAAPPPKPEPKFFGSPGDSSNADRVEEAVKKALGPIYDKFSKLEEAQSRVVEMDLKGRLQRQFPELDELDVDNVFETAFRDRSKNLSQHAEVYLQSKKERLGALRKQHAQEFGINLEEWEKQKIEEREKKEKGLDDLSFLVHDKKVSFDARDDKSVSPKKAMMEYFKKHGR